MTRTLVELSVATGVSFGELVVLDPSIIATYIDVLREANSRR